MLRPLRSYPTIMHGSLSCEPQGERGAINTDDSYWRGRPASLMVLNTWLESINNSWALQIQRRWRISMDITTAVSVAPWS